MSNNLDINPATQYINLVTFNWNDGAAQFRYWTAYDQQYVGTDFTFDPVPAMKITFGKQAGGIEDVPVTIQMAAVDPLITMLVGYPFAKTTVLIEEVDPTDNTTRRKIFFGTVGLITGNKNGAAGLVEIRIDGLKSQMAFALGIQVMNTCAWQFGDKNCKVNPPTETATISNIGGTVITVASPTGSAVNYQRGYVTYGGVSLLIKKQVSTTVFNLVNIPPPAWLGKAVKFTAGCLKTSDDCKNKWNNIANFGGFGWAIPNYNPTTETQ